MDKQTEEIKAMAKAIFETGEAIEGIDLVYASLHGADSDSETKFMRIAKHLYCNDYRKASDVAREIFAEIKQYFIVKNLGLLNATYTKDFFRELQKKYEREEANDETDT